MLEELTMGGPGAQQLLPQGIITRPQRNMLMKHLRLLLLVLVLLFGRLNPQGKKLAIFGIKQRKERLNGLNHTYIIFC